MNRYILVYPSSKNYSRIIVHQDYTDYVNYTKNHQNFQILVERCYRDGVAAGSNVTIEIVGAKKYTVDGKYQPKYRDNTLSFTLPLNTTFTIPDLVIG